MEKGAVGKKRPGKMGLNGLFWRYLITTGTLAAVLCIAWLLLFNILVNMGFVMSAYTAVRGLEKTERLLREQPVFDPVEIPFYYEWALVEDGNIVKSSMNEKQLSYAYDELAGYSAPHGWLYTQYFHTVPLADGRRVMLVYDYAVCYGNPHLQEVLPDFQMIYIGLFILLALLLVTVCTRHYARILQRDARAITDACEMVRRQQLETPLQGTAPEAVSPEGMSLKGTFAKGQTRVRELQAALETIDTLRQELSRSLKEQWNAEQQKNEALSALTHDLKTPLTVIAGNAELLAEDGLTGEQQELAETILRNAGHAEEYLQRLRQVTAEEFFAARKEKMPLCRLAEDWVQCGRDLAAVKGREFIVNKSIGLLSEETIEIAESEVLRAVENLLSNAMRFTPAGGRVELGIEWQDRQAGIWVQDSGPGFSAEALAKAGKTFYTQESSRPQNGHMGMGLYFAAQVARQHGGRLVLENTKTGGRATLWL